MQPQLRLPVESLEVFQLAHQLAIRVREITKRFPKEERFELGSQLRRAALAIPTNIAEGNARGAPREYLYFCKVARGSLGEVRYLLRFALDVGLLDSGTYADVAVAYDRVGKMLYALIVTLKGRRGWKEQSG